jgi:methionyl-tRNA formyltransferase
MTTRVAFLGTAAIARPVLRALHGAGYEIGVVVTQPDRPRGRSKRLVPSPVKEEALALGLACPIFQPELFKKRRAREHFEGLGPFDLGVVVAYGQILTRQVLAVPRLGMVNCHASLLPRWRGAAPVQRAILAGDKETGVTTMRMVPRLDAGDMLATNRTPIGLADTAEGLLARLGDVAAELLLRTLPEILDETISATPQDESLVTYAAQIRKDEGKLDWAWHADEVGRHLRAMTPWPRSFAFAESDGASAPTRLILCAGRAVERPAGTAGAEPGAVLERGPEGFVVACGDSTAFLVTEVQPAGKRRMDVAAYLRGLPADGLTRLG